MKDVPKLYMTEHSIITTHVLGCADVVDHGVQLRHARAIKKTVRLLIENQNVEGLGKAAFPTLVPKFPVNYRTPKLFNQYIDVPVDWKPLLWRSF